MEAGLRPFLDRLTSRSRLTGIEQEAILQLPSVDLRIDAHRDVVRLGEAVDHVSIVTDGFVGRFGQNAQGERQLTALHIAGDAPDLHLVVVPSDTCPLQSLSDTRISRVPHAELREVAARFPAVAEAFWRHCSVDAAITAQWVVNLGRRDARTRIAHLLCEMAVRCGVDLKGGEIDFPFPLTQTHLADATGLTPVHINRTLKALASEDLVYLADRKARIPDWKRLVQHGEFETGYLHAALEPHDCFARPMRATA